MSVVEGSAVVQRGGSGVQTAAVRNAPMLPGDYISTGKTSRAELQFDGYTAVRLGGNVQARIAEDDANNRKVQLASGTIEVGMVHDGQAMQIDTPSASVRAPQAGDVRISIAADGSTWVTARRGSADVVTPQHTYTIGTGKTLVAAGSASHPSIGYDPEIAFDSFDEFNVERDKTMVAAVNASPNVNPTIAGYDDLGAYGRWQTVAGYGQSWLPDEPAGWVPYRYGSWAWEGRYSWTWIGSEPWGWTPYHYGNWYYCDCGSSGWAWLPPAYTATPAWAPALVGFFGFDVASAGGYPNCGSNYGYAPTSYEAPAAPPENAAPAAPYGAAPPAAPYGSSTPAPYGVGGPGPGGYPPSEYGVGGPGYPPPYGYPYPYIGWVPIAPFEPFYPWYLGFGYGYPAGFATNIVNITNIRNVTRIYRNFRHGGATATSIRHFRHGTVSGHTIAVRPRDIGRRFGTIHGALPIKPTRNNLAFSHGMVHAPVTFSKAFDSQRFALHRALAARTSSARQPKRVAQAGRARLNGHATAHAAVSRALAAVSRQGAPVSRANVPQTHAEAFRTRTREAAAMPHRIAATQRENVPVARENPARVMREHSAPAIRSENGAAMGENSAMREGAAPRQVEVTRNDSGPSASWDRFNEARGEARPAAFPARSGDTSSGAGTREGELSARESAREPAPSDSWGRFSASRGEASASTRDPYAQHGSYASPYSRGSYASPYSRGSYSGPSYSRRSYASPYSRGSYSAPSYSRGSYRSAPTYSRGYSSRGYSAPSRSWGGGNSGRGGGGHGGRGRPPRSG